MREKQIEQHMGLFGMVGSATVLSIGEWAINSVINLYESFTAASAITGVALSAQISWDKADKNHILNGSKNHDRHDWSMFGINPNDPNAWAKLLPILKKVADYGMEFSREPARGGGEIRQYVLDFTNEATSVVLKLFINSNGGISLSDAWTLPYNFSPN